MGPGRRPMVSRRKRRNSSRHEIRPILVEKCLNCHGPKKQSSSLRLDSREAILKGGDSGPAAVPSRPDESLMIQAVAHRHEDLKMPPKGKLPDAGGGTADAVGRDGLPRGRRGWASPGSRRREPTPPPSTGPSGQCDRTLRPR